MITYPHYHNYLQCANVGMSSAGRSIEQVCRQAGYAPPVICVPHELMEPDRFFSSVEVPDFHSPT